MNVDKDVDIRKWAAEGLAYLTLDADVKDELCNDTNAVNSLLDLAKVNNDLYLKLSIKTIFVLYSCYG